MNLSRAVRAGVCVSLWAAAVLIGVPPLSGWLLPLPWS